MAGVIGPWNFPFGGSRMSGVGFRAGGPDYLLQCLEPRTVTENVSAGDPGVVRDLGLS